MYLKSIDFYHKPSSGNGWAIKDCEFNAINLISGKNASGKTRLLNAINSVANLLSRDQVKLKDNIAVQWTIKLQNKADEVSYKFSSENNCITKEELRINEEIYLTRGPEGEGRIKYKELGREIDFEVEKNKIIATSKRDKKQHPFLELLFDWSEHVFLYKFGGLLGRDTLFSIKESNKLNIGKNELEKLNKDDDGVVPKFELGMTKFGKRFKMQIVRDFNSIGYFIDDIYLAPYHQFLDKETGSVPNILYIAEHGCSDEISQAEISQGMFRVLSLIIQLAYLEFNSTSYSTVLIDDIGEGLDFDRSANLIKFLVSKAENLKDKIQLVMTTNDRFVMNSVSLDYWTVIDKSEGGIELYSEKSNHDLFEDFKYIGLNNFDFFSGQYYKRQ